VGEIFERVLPATALEWTGERLTTATSGQVEIEHLHRYFLARELCRGLDVLDVASGEGYGSALLAQSARSVVGVELSDQAVAHAAAAYVAPNLHFLQGDARDLPLGNASVDAVVSFETLEHFFEHARFIAEIRRVLRPSGRLILSSPERDVYSPPGSAANPYHVHELSRGELEALLRSTFPHLHVLAQRPMIGSALVAGNDAGSPRTLTFERRGPRHYEASRGLPRPPYVIVIASGEALPPIPNCLYIETSEVGELLSRAAADASALGRTEAAYQTVREELARSVAQAREIETSAERQLREVHEAAQAQANRAEQAEAALTELRGELARITAELSAARGHCNALRVAFRRHAASFASGGWASARTASLEAEARIASLEAEARAASLEAEARIASLEAEARAASLEAEARIASLEAEAHAASLEAEARAASLEAEAAAWSDRYFNLRSRLETILQRFWILRAARVTPAPLRRFVRERLLGPRRQP
jgi:SAM-dependent methyltransferase